LFSLDDKRIDASSTVNRALLLSAALVASSHALLAEVTFEGRVLGVHDKPLQSVQIWIQREPYRKDGDFRTQTDSNGRFALTNLPPGEYSISVVRIEGVDDFVVSHIQARAGDTWGIDYNMRRRTATIRNQGSKSLRRFEYLGSRTKLLAGGDWTETTNGLPRGTRECAELRSHPTIVSRGGVVLCAKHHIPLISAHGFGSTDYAKRERTITLIHTWGLQRRREECNPNHIPLDQSLHRSKDRPIPLVITYCPKCEDAVWLTEEENRKNLAGEYGR
jgi:Carboxypeptidase regulatory-like domain